jgi:hypothetical protein
MNNLNVINKCFVSVLCVLCDNAVVVEILYLVEIRLVWLVYFLVFSYES